MVFKTSTTRFIGRFTDNKYELMISYISEEGLTICERDIKTGSVIGVSRAIMHKKYEPNFIGEVYWGEAMGKREITGENVLKVVTSHYSREENSLEVSEYRVENPHLHPTHSSKLLGYSFFQFVSENGVERVLVRFDLTNFLSPGKTISLDLTKASFRLRKDYIPEVRNGWTVIC